MLSPSPSANVTFEKGVAVWSSLMLVFAVVFMIVGAKFVTTLIVFSTTGLTASPFGPEIGKIVFVKKSANAV